MRFSIRAVSQRRYKTRVFPFANCENMEFRQRLGSGGFADVYEGVYQNQTVAIKKIRSNTKNPLASREAFEAESRLLGLNHRHVIRLIAVQTEAVIIMEWIPNATNLQTLINQDAPYPWRKYAQQLVAAISYLHYNDVLHLDVKPANVLVDTNHHCKVIDFGCAQSDSNPEKSSMQGTPAYRAPELFQGKQPTTKADVYSLAVTLWSLKHQQLPYQGQNNDIVIYQVVAFKRRPSHDPEFEMLWHSDPQQRPEVDGISF